MKQRTTFLVQPGNSFGTEDIQIGQNHLNFTKAHHADVEDRLTVGLSELPDELRLALRDVHELHIKWVSRKNYHASSPLLSRLPPGLHATFTPLVPDTDICPLLKRMFSSQLKCHVVRDSFSTPALLSERFSSTAAYQYYHSLESLEHFRDAVRECVCRDRGEECDRMVDPFSLANYVDLDFDAISHAVIIATVYSSDAGFLRQGDTARLYARKPSHSIEVGILQLEKPDVDEPEELKLGGYLTPLGDPDDEPKASGTLFSFPSRHHAHPGTFRAAFQQPTGLHPILAVTLPRQHLSAPKASCALHAYLTLPSALFLDRYQLSDALYLQSHNLLSLRSLTGETDLEAPDWVVSRWGSAALFELAVPDPSAASKDAWKDGPWTVTVPLHLRYLQAGNESSQSSRETGYADIDVPWPVVFWACNAQEGSKFATNPFDRTNLGYDGLFGPRTMFYHVAPDAAARSEGGSLVQRLSVPVLDVSDAQAWWAQVGTLVVVSMGLGWVVRQLVPTSGLFGRDQVDQSKEKR